MKKIIPWLLGLTGLTILSARADVSLAWDPSTSPDVTNYVIYAHTNSITETNRLIALVRLPVGTNLTAKIERLVPGVWFFRASAQRNGLESELSNEVVAEVPRAPERLRTVFVQYSITLTNFYDVGFFRLRLP